MSRPYLAALRPSGTHKPRTHQTAPTPEREHASKQASRARGGGGTTLSHHPPRERTQASTQTPQANTPPAQTPNPNHPPSKHAHNKPRCHPRANTRAPTPTARGQNSVSAGTRGRVGDRHEAKQGETPTRAGTQDKRTQGERANNGVCAEAVPPCARQTGVRRERKAAHNSPRQSAWVVVFVGVFADVCRRFWAGWFGGLGVFWGCLACFLVF